MPGATTTGPPALACFCGTSPCPVYNWIGDCEGCRFSALMDTNGGGVNDDRRSTPDNNCGSGSSPSCAPIRRTENRNIRGLNNQTPPSPVGVSH